MPNIWIINQFANTPDLPGHTRQYEIALALAQKNWNLNVFSSDFNLTKRTYCKLKGFQIRKIENINGIKWHWIRVSPYTKNNWKRYLNLISFCLNLLLSTVSLLITSRKKNTYPDIILASSPQLPVAFISLLFAKILNKAFILEVRDLWPQVLIDLGNLSSKNIIVRILRWMEITLYKNSDYVVVLAKGSEKYVKSKGARKTIWLPNGPDLNLFKYKVISNQEVFTNEKPFSIIYTGAHGEANGLENVVKAAKLLQSLPVKFILIGDGPLKNDLVEKAKNLINIEFRNPVSKKKIPNILSHADAVLLSLRKVALFEYGVSPNKLYDAYAIGRPVITTVDGDINNEVSINKLGFTASSSNPEDLAIAVKKMFNTSRFDRLQMGIRARKMAENIYSRQRINLIYEEIFEGLLSDKNVLKK